MRFVSSMTPRVVEILTKAVYWIAAVFFLSLGAAVLVVGTGILPGWLHDQIFAIGQNNPLMMHLIQETGTLWILVGMLFVWAARHYAQSAGFHWAVTFYWALDAWVHWFNAYGQFENEPRALYNAIPFVLFLTLGLLRTRVRGRTRTPAGVHVG